MGNARGCEVGLISWFYYLMGDMNLYLTIFIAGLGSLQEIRYIFILGDLINLMYIKISGQRKSLLWHSLLQNMVSPIIFIQKDIYGMRTIIPISIGLTRYDAKNFTFINLISAWCWAAIK